MNDPHAAYLPPSASRRASSSSSSTSSAAHPHHAPTSYSPPFPPTSTSSSSFSRRQSANEVSSHRLCFCRVASQRVYRPRADRRSITSLLLVRLLPDLPTLDHLPSHARPLSLPHRPPQYHFSLHLQTHLVLLLSLPTTAVPPTSDSTPCAHRRYRHLQLVHIVQEVDSRGAGESEEDQP